MLRVENIYKDYDNKPLLNGVSFKVAEGELVCLLGSSGSGKSTMLRIIAGLEDAATGQIYWNEDDITHLPTHQRGFGLMFQDYALFPHKTVAENIAFGLRMNDRPKQEIDSIVEKSLQGIRMLSFANRPVTELSGGEQQRVALARALAPNPRLLMLDEPLGALDHNLRSELIKELRRQLHESQKPVIYVTHDQEEAFALADRLLLLHKGLLVQQGAPEEVFRQPANAWVASFLGLGNLISGTVNQEGKLQNDISCLKLPLGSTASPGEHKSLLLRPEQAVINAYPSEGRLSMEAEVVDCVFLGEHYRLEVLAEGNLLLVHSQQPFQSGERIRVSWQPEQVLCLPE